MELYFDDSTVDGYRSILTKTSLEILPFIGKEPDYLSDQPRFGTFMFSMQIPVWAVLDQSEQAEQAGYYDILYLDKNADGNLVQENEKFVGEYDADNGLVRFSVGDLKDPCSGWVYGMYSGEHQHTNWTITASAETRPSVQMSLTMDGSYRVSGPANGTFVFSNTKGNAPIQAVYCGGEMNFQLSEEKKSWGIGQTIALRLRLATAADGDFHGCLVEHSSFPAETPIQLQLSYQTKDGNSRVYKTELAERNGRYEFLGSIQVPEDARPGPAEVQFHLPGKPIDQSRDSSYRLVKTTGGEDLFFSPTTLKIDLVRP